MGKKGGGRRVARKVHSHAKERGPQKKEGTSKERGDLKRKRGKYIHTRRCSGRKRGVPGKRGDAFARADARNKCGGEPHAPFLPLQLVFGLHWRELRRHTCAALLDSALEGDPAPQKWPISARRFPIGPAAKTEGWPIVPQTAAYSGIKKRRARFFLFFGPKCAPLLYFRLGVRTVSGRLTCFGPPLEAPCWPWARAIAYTPTTP